MSWDPISRSRSGEGAERNGRSSGRGSRDRRRHQQQQLDDDHLGLTSPPSSSADPPARYETHYESMRDQYADLMMDSGGSRGSFSSGSNKGSKHNSGKKKNKKGKSPPSSPRTSSTKRESSSPRSSIKKPSSTTSDRNSSDRLLSQPDDVGGTYGDINNSNSSNSHHQQHSNNTKKMTYNYRGFSTSIGDMFMDPQQERVDCCAMTCCGIFQSDRDRYLLQGVTPPSPFKRFWVHVGMPVILFLMSGYAALHVPDKFLNEFIVVAFLLMLLGGIVTQCQKGRIKRMDIRKDILWYKYQLLKNKNGGGGDGNNNHDENEVSLDQVLHRPRPHNDYDESDDDEEHSYYYRGQTPRDIGCSHPYCFFVGCYPNDKPTTTTACGTRQVTTKDDNVVEESLCGCIFKFFFGRPYCLGNYIQCFGICGMAQESREIESTLLPPQYRRLDYITMQPMMTYMEHIYNRRWEQFNTNQPFNSYNNNKSHNNNNDNDGGGPKVNGPFHLSSLSTSTFHMPHLSDLSKTIIKGWIALTVFLGVWSFLGPIFWTQFLQGEGRRHYFSIGDYIVYLISWVVCFATLALVVYLCENSSDKKKKPLQLSVDAMIKYFACGFVLSTTLSIFYELVLGFTVRLVMLIFMTLTGVQVVEDSGYEMMMDWAVREPLLSMGFGGGGVGHPLGITSAAATGEDYLPVFGRDHPFAYSIYLFVNSYFLAALIEELCKYFGYRMLEHPDFMSRKDLEDAVQTGTHGSGKGGGASQEEQQQQQHRVSFPHHGSSLEAQGAAVTVAMVCVALGVSCCEDLVYVFFYNGSSVEMELYVLIARTLFPIHPIAAALQSIGVCERDVEKNPTRIGRILLPAVLFHGTYDFLLLWIDFLASLKRSDGYDNVNSDQAIEIGTNAVIASYLTSASIMAAALYWFFQESKKQRERLAARDLETDGFSAM